MLLLFDKSEHLWSVIDLSQKDSSLDTEVNFMDKFFSDTFEVFLHPGHHHLNRGTVISDQLIEPSKLNQVNIRISMHLPTLLRPTQTEPTASTLLPQTQISHRFMMIWTNWHFELIFSKHTDINIFLRYSASNNWCPSGRPVVVFTLSEGWLS